MRRQRDGKEDAFFLALTEEILGRCLVVAGYSEEPGKITRTFLCEPMHGLHERLGAWMRDAGMSVRMDAVGNLIGHFAAEREAAPLLLIGSHVDSVPDAGKYDGVLGVLLGIAAIQAQKRRPFPFAVEVIAFSEEEGIRYGTPYLGSSAAAGRFDPAWLERKDSVGLPMADAIRRFGLDPAQIPQAAYKSNRLLGYLEVHIEQGPELESLNLPVSVVEAIVGQSRLWTHFRGKAGHAGTLPMEARHDALTAAAELILAVEHEARSRHGLRATVGTISVAPGAINVVPGSAKLSLDVRHAYDKEREEALAALVRRAEDIACRRGVCFEIDYAENHRAVPTAPRLTDLLAAAIRAVGLAPHRMVSGAGHDSAVMASTTSMAMLFVRSPGGISHHPDEAILPEDVAVALRVMVDFLSRLAGESA
jgi:allantoate deiminase